MNDLNKTDTTHKLSQWEILAVFTGVIITVPMLALLGSAIYGAMIDRPGSYAGILLTIIIMLLFWAIIWGGIWMSYSSRTRSAAQSISASKLEELERENERLRKQVAELKGEKG